MNKCVCVNCLLNPNFKPFRKFKARLGNLVSCTCSCSWSCSIGHYHLLIPFIVYLTST